MNTLISPPRPIVSNDAERRSGPRRLPGDAARDGAASPAAAVVIPAFNAEKFLRETMESVFVQTLSNIEVIVVDDGSTDSTHAILETFSDPRMTVLRQENRGVSAARNAGLALARAPHVFFLDADDILLPNALHRMVRTLEQNPHCVAAFAHHVRITERGEEIASRSYLRWKVFPAADTLRHLAAKNFISGAICVRTEIARSIGGFNTALKLGEDWEFWCRLAALGDFAPMPTDVVLLYRQRFGSANFRWRRSPLHPNFRAIEAVYSNPTIQERFPPSELRRRRRLAEIDAFWTGARNEYVQGRMLKFLAYMVVGTLRYPDSILRPRLVYLFLRGLRQQIVPQTDAPTNP